MNQGTAKRLLRDGGIFLFLDVPEGTEFGIDLKSWNTGEKFRGVKMIPPGIHYIFYSSVSSTGDTAPRTGFFHNFHKSEVIVKRWSRVDEDVSLVDVSDSEIVALRENLLHLDEFLGPYPFDIKGKWEDLSGHVTQELIERLSPETGCVRSALELFSCERHNLPGTSSGPPKRVRLSNVEETEDSLLPNLQPRPGTSIRTTSLPEKNYPDSASAAEITRHSLDLSYSLNTMLTTYLYPLDIIGEIEFLYICFLVGHSLEAFEHWKCLVSLLCSCESGIKVQRQIFDAFLTTLPVQVREIPEEFLADIVSNNNFVYVKLRSLFRAIESIDIDDVLKSKAERFKNSLTANYFWDFTHLESDDDDELPVIVETTEVC